MPNIRFNLLKRLPCNANGNVFHNAIARNRLKLVEKFILNVHSLPCLVEICKQPLGRDGQTALHQLFIKHWRIHVGTYSERCVSLEYFAQVVDKLAQEDIEDTKSILNMEDDNGQSVVKMIRNGKPTKNSENIVHIAISKGFINLFTVLLEIGLNLNEMKFENGDNVLTLAATFGQCSLAQLIVNQKSLKISINDANESGYTPLMISAMKHDVDFVQFLFDCDNPYVRVNAKNHRGETALSMSIRHGDLKFVESFLEGGANINTVNNHEETVLFQVVRMGDDFCDIALRLLQCGVKVNSTNDFGYSPLLVAVCEGHYQLFKLLLEFGADLTLKHFYGRNALMEAALRGNSKICREICQEARQEIDEKDSNGETALMIASRLGFDSTVQTLLDFGASTTLTCEKLKTARDKAIEKGNLKTAELLIRHDQKHGCCLQ